MTRHAAKTPTKTADFPGLNQTRAAAAIGVTREHLNRVLRGHRTSRRLLAKIATFVRSQKGAAK